MRKCVVLSLGVIIACLGGGAPALAASGGGLAREGIDLCREALFEKCVEKLNSAKATGGLSRDELVEVNRYLGSAYLTLDRKDLAEAVYRDLLAVDLSYELDPTTTNPEHLKFFRLVKEKVKKEKPRLPIKVLHFPPERALPGKAV
jgi:hypothetical protein